MHLPAEARRRPILVVEDDEDIRDFLVDVLGDAGYRVLAAPNGAVALDLINDPVPLAILLDMKMPVMDGWEFASRYRRSPAPEAPIIVMTAAHDAAARAQQIGAAGLLPKPFEVDHLLEAVRLATVA
jgi:CheY-like chemotaxis protein